jgi:chromosomal replication initiation ATPase DnaA
LTAFDPKAKVIVERVCASFEIEYKKLVSQDRRPVVSIPRHILAYAIKTELDFSQNRIAEIVGRERSSVSHSLNVVKIMMETRDALFMSYYNKLKTA